jgi:hypothetical protein
MFRADSITVVHPLFQAEGSGSIPTSALCLHFQKIDLKVAKSCNRLWHSRFPEMGGGGCRVAYGAEFNGRLWSIAVWTNPSSPKLPQLEWLQLSRFAVCDEAPKNTASRMMGWMVRDIRKRFTGVTTLVSYSDPDSHRGTIYRSTGWSEGDTTDRRGSGWANRSRSASAMNVPCLRVTRWTRKI